MKKYTWLVLILSLAMLAGCGILDDPKPTATPDSPSQSTTDPEPVESEQPSDGINPEPPNLADRKPVENREPAVIVVPDETDDKTDIQPPEENAVPEVVPSPDIMTDVPVRADAEFCGEWFAREADSTGEIRAIRLILKEDGSAYYEYGVPYREMLEVFEGRWREEGENLVLDLYGGPISDDGTYDYDYCRDLDVYFKWEMQGVALVCEPAGGDTLLKGTGGEWYTFRPFDAFKLSGTWGADGGTLQLKENGGCIYSVTENGTLLAEYSGTWRYKDGQLTLSMTMSGGSRYDEGQRGQIAGTYREEYSVADELVLTRISGSAINDAMENGSSVIFKKQ